MIIDSHAHYTHHKFDGTYKFLNIHDDDYALDEGTREDVLKLMKQEGIDCFVEPGINLASNDKILEFQKKCPDLIFPAIGVHPTRTFSEKWSDRKRLLDLAKNDCVVAIGETGLDYHYERKDQHRFVQLMWFLYQLKLAKKLNLPLVVHIRNAHNSAIRILKLYSGRKNGGVVHCFNGDYNIAKKYVELGYHLGIGGALLQNTEKCIELQDAVRRIPLEYILVETDAPYVHPDCRNEIGKRQLSKSRNTSLILPKVIKRIAELKNITYEKVEETTMQNVIKLFGLNVPNNPKK